MRNCISILLIFVILMLANFAFGVVKSEANTQAYAGIIIEDNKGVCLGYVEPGTGGYFGSFNIVENYTDCYYIMGSTNNYGNTINTELGTFTYRSEATEEEHESWEALEGNDVNYIYTCPVDSEILKCVGNRFLASGMIEFNIKGINQNTNNEDDIKIYMDIFKTLFYDNAELKVGNQNVIINGNMATKNTYWKNESERGQWNDDIAFFAYNAFNNTLLINSWSTDVSYSNMGANFSIITRGKNCNINVLSEDKKTGIKISASNSNLPSTIELNTEKIINGEKYESVLNTLKNITSKFCVYDISLKNAGVFIQPNGKVKISIPIPSNYKKDFLEVY